MLDHGGFRLRPWTAADAPALITATTGDEALNRWTGVRAATPEHAALYLQAQLVGWQSGERYAFAVLDDETLVGSVAVKLPGNEIGYWTVATARGRGVAPAAVEAATRWAFTTLGLPHLDLFHQIGNTASCRVADKTGYTLSETLPPSAFYTNPGHRHTRRP